MIPLLVKEGLAVVDFQAAITDRSDADLRPGPDRGYRSAESFRSLWRDRTACWRTYRRSAGVSDSIQRMGVRSTPSSL